MFVRGENVHSRDPTESIVSTWDSLRSLIFKHTRRRRRCAVVLILRLPMCKADRHRPLYPSQAFHAQKARFTHPRPDFATHLPLWLIAQPSVEFPPGMPRNSHTSPQSWARRCGNDQDHERRRKDLLDRESSKDLYLPSLAFDYIYRALISLHCG
jgi:hypothetical protein